MKQVQTILDQSDFYGMTILEDIREQGGVVFVSPEDRDVINTHHFEHNTPERSIQEIGQDLLDGYAYYEQSYRHTDTALIDREHFPTHWQIMNQEKEADEALNGLREERNIRFDDPTQTYK